MTAAGEVVKRFYAAAQAADGTAILAILHPQFQARTAPGMPCGAGGTFPGPQLALTRLWGAVFKNFDTALRRDLAGDHRRDHCRHRPLPGHRPCHRARLRSRVHPPVAGHRRTHLLAAPVHRHRTLARGPLPGGTLMPNPAWISRPLYMYKGFDADAGAPQRRRDRADASR